MTTQEDVQILRRLIGYSKIPFADAAREALDRIEKQLAEKDGTCEWHKVSDTDGWWSPACTPRMRAYYYTSPTENGEKYCCWCRKPIVVKETGK